METLLSITLVIAQGRGDNPSTAEGALIVAGIALGLAMLGLLGHWLVHRFGRTRAKSLDHEPHPPGRVGRASKQRGP